MATRTVIVPSVSSLVLIGLYGLTSLTNSCSGDGYNARNTHASSHVDNGGIIGDYKPVSTAKPVAAAGQSDADGDAMRGTRE